MPQPGEPVKSTIQIAGYKTHHGSRDKSVVFRLDSRQHSNLVAIDQFVKILQLGLEARFIIQSFGLPNELQKKLSGILPYMDLLACLPVL